VIAVAALFPLLFVAAQGGVIFLTAFVGLRVLKTNHWLAKIFSMAVSYAAWILLTISGYFMLGGEGGLMDGFGFVLTLCFSALVSSGIYTVGWVLAPFIRRSAHG
jgi:hypothetical protein